MRRVLLLILLLPVITTAQSARTAERVLTVPFSSLSSSLPDGSVRHVVGAAANASGVCVAGASQMMATKLSGLWKCSDIPGGAGGSGGAPFNATFITQTPNSTLTNEQALSSLSNGILKHAAGVIQQAVAGTDFLTPTGSGAGLTSLNATQLLSGTIPDGRFPAIFPVISGANLTALNASQLISGTVPDARFPATLPVMSGVNLTNLNASNLATGTVAPARLGTGSGGATKFLREDNSWQTIGGGGDALVANPLSQFAATTSAQLAGVITDETGTNKLVYSDNPIILTPTIASFVNATHDHSNAAGGGQITDAALSSAVQISKGGTGQTTATAGFNALDPLTTKGDVLSHDGTNSVRLAVGTNGQCVKANSATSTGLEWGTCGSGAGTIGGTVGSTDNAVPRADGTGGSTLQGSGVTIDDSNNVTTAGTITSGSGSSVAGSVDLGEGTAPALVANTFSIYAPTDVAAGGLAYVVPAAAASGVLRATNSSGVMTITHDAGLSHLASSTSADLAAVLSNETGSGAAVFGTSPTLVTPTLGAAVATSINGLTISTSTGTLTIANAKTFTANNTVTLSGTDGSTVAFGAGGTVTYTIASGTAALGTSAIASGACASAVTVTATGTATTDVVGWGFNGDPTGVTGYAPSANGMLTIIAYPTANNVSFKVCNNLASSVTPGAITLNWRVTR